MNEELLWQAVITRDDAWDGRFVYGVVTTGVYCRPSCASRQPLRQNVRFYDGPVTAENDGLRPCKRCGPDRLVAGDAVEGRMHSLCRYIEANLDQSLTLEHLGRQAHMSPHYLQRRFKAIIGVTPKQYIQGCRLGSFKRGLRAREAVTDAVYDAGFGSTSRLYEKVTTHIGMTPTEYQSGGRRSGGRSIEISYASTETPLGLLIMAATDRGLCFVELGDDEGELRENLMAEYPSATISPMPANSDTPFWQWMQALCDYLAGEGARLDLPTDIRGTAFQMKVWDYLSRIPRGELKTYKEVAEAIGRPTAVRAVANACGANRVALAIPCHRVIRGDGGLGGYRWGVERKRKLIERERSEHQAGLETA